jgi:N-acyl-D-aspartate/D-glutamate deacylase
MQQVDGYEATIVSGVVTQRAGKATGARPGKLVRGAQGTKPQMDAAAS